MAGLLASCREPNVTAYPQAPVVLISIDTLRADRLPAYGYAAGSTPALAVFSREAVLFEDAYSHCPLTLPAHASLFTGRLPPHHGVRDNIGFTLADGEQTLAERFKATGRPTGGAVSAYVLRAQTGIAQGFDFYDDRLEVEAGLESLGELQRDGAVAVDSLSRWIEERGEAPFFAFLHLYEPHSPYKPPARHARGQPYDGEVAYADELVGRFLDRLKARGVYDRALVVVTSDHGEGLGDHAEEEHGMFLYREAVRVPLFIRLPRGARGGLRVKGTVAQADVAATLLDLAGVAAPGLDGVSLREAIAKGAAGGRPVYSETLYPRYHFGWSELFAATDPRYRYIRAPRPELFDVTADPGEKTNLASARVATASAMAGWLERQASAAATPQEVDPATREKLQALGYVGSGAAVAAGATLPDPKDKIGAYEALKKALALGKAGRDAEAVAQFRTVLADNPGMIDAWETLGLTLIRMGRTNEGIAAVDRALTLDPTRVTAHLALAKVHALEGRLDRAVRHAEIATARNPGQGNELLAQAMMDRGDLGRAAVFARKSVEADSQRIMSHFILGLAAQHEGRCEEALAAFRRAEAAQRLQKGTAVRDLHANMADCLARLGRDAEAEQEFLAEIRAIPHSEKGRVGLAMLYRSQSRDQEARAVLGGLIAALPQPSADAYWRVVQTFAVLGDTAAAEEWAARARARFPTDARFSAAPGRRAPRPPAG
jgi:arylsulfatase A-like enzyme/Tfp pilus assembly protein PilF